MEMNNLQDLYLCVSHKTDYIIELIMEESHTKDYIKREIINIISIIGSEDTCYMCKAHKEWKDAAGRHDNVSI